MIRCLLTFTISFILFLNEFEAQSNLSDLEEGTLVFLSGDTLTFKMVEKSDLFVSGFKQNRYNDKWKLKTFDANNILYYQTQNEKKFFYEYKPSQGDFLSQPEMAQFVLGKKDALYNYSPKNKFFQSAMLGVIIGVLDASFDFYYEDSWQFNEPYVGFLNGKSGLISLSVPLFATFLVGQNRLNLIDRTIMSEKDVLQESFNHGFHGIKKSKDSKAVAKGSLIGMLSVVLVSSIISSNQ